MLMVSKLTPRQVVARMLSGSRVSFVDARSAQDWTHAAWKISGAVRATLPTLVQDAAQLPHAQVLVVYGHDGQEAEVPQVAEALRALGHREVRILSGGFAAWSELQFAVQPARDALAS